MLSTTKPSKDLDLLIAKLTVMNVNANVMLVIAVKVKHFIVTMMQNVNEKVVNAVKITNVTQN